MVKHTLCLFAAPFLTAINFKIPSIIFGWACALGVSNVWQLHVLWVLLRLVELPPVLDVLCDFVHWKKVKSYAMKV